MAPPTKHADTPPCWVRTGISRGRLVGLIVSNNWLDTETAKIRARLPAGDRGKKYWVISMPSALADRDGREFSITAVPPGTTKAAAFDRLEDAETQYDSWCQSDAGLPAIVRGVRGLQKIGVGDSGRD